MTRFVADHNFNHDIVAGLSRRQPDVDIVTLQELGLARANDPTVLEWAARNERIVLTHDVNTMTGHANERVKLGLRIPGVVVVKSAAPVGRVVADLHMMDDRVQLR